MDIKTVAALVAAFGIGANVAMRMFESYLSPMWKKIIGGTSLGLMVISGGMLLYALVTGIEAKDIKNIPSINQTITDSPGAINALGDVTVNQEQPPWGLTENQKVQLVTALKKHAIPPETTYQLKIFIPDRCERCAGYANDLGETWYGMPGWEVRSIGSYILDVRLQGVFVGVDVEGCSPEPLLLVMNALEAAEIKYERVRTEGKLGLGACVVIVGNRPQG